MLRQFVFAVAVSLATGAVACAIEHTQDSTDLVKRGLKEGTAVLLDVREFDEWEADHLKDARHLPFNQLREGMKADDVEKVSPKGKIVYCHCKAGRRALGAGMALEKMGYDVRPLKMGYDELLKEGFEKASAEEKK